MRGSSLLALLLLALPALAAAAPARIVSMNPCTDAILVAVADAGQIAAISHWSHDPAATSLPLAVATRFPAQGGTAEEVIARRPDLVILSPHTPLATKSALGRLGIATLEVGVPNSVAESVGQVRAIAAAAGHPARGEALAGAISAAVAAARRPGPPQPALMRMASGLVPGPGTLADALMANSGLRSLAPRYGLARWDVLPLEPMAADPPRLLLTDRPEALHPIVSRLMIRVVPFDRQLLNCGGPSIIAASRRLAAIRDGRP